MEKPDEITSLTAAEVLERLTAVWGLANRLERAGHPDAADAMAKARALRALIRRAVPQWQSGTKPRAAVLAHWPGRQPA